jgi:hypothetical protein
LNVAVNQGKNTETAMATAATAMTTSFLDQRAGLNQVPA